MGVYSDVIRKRDLCGPRIKNFEKIKNRFEKRCFTNFIGNDKTENYKIVVKDILSLCQDFKISVIIFP